MFDFPLIKNKNSLYHKFNLTPCAPDAEIKQFQSGMDNILAKKKNELIKKNTEISEKSTKFKETEQKYKEKEQELLKVTDKKRFKEEETNLKKLNDIKDQLRKELSKNPDYELFEKQLNEINQQINDNKLLDIADKTKREKYDCDNPPFSILKFDTFDCQMFQDSKTVLFLLRKELGSFFKSKFKLKCYHPSDFTRTDFSSDFTYNSKLDNNE